jgi:hypothetical protein
VKEELGLRVSKNRALRNLLWFKRKKEEGNWIICVIRNFPNAL